MPPPEEPNRMLGLEERYMHLERLVEQLNEVITAQQSAIDRLGRDVTQLREQLRSGTGEDAGDQPPPHY